jgi:hypothetical protein
VAEVDEVLVAGGALVAGVGAPFGEERLGCHGRSVAGGAAMGEARGACGTVRENDYGARLFSDARLHYGHRG